MPVANPQYLLRLGGSDESESLPIFPKRVSAKGRYDIAACHRQGSLTLNPGTVNLSADRQA